MAVMDSVGVALAGSKEEAGKIITGCIKEMGGKPLASIIGKGFRTTPHLAALANGTMVHALDYDDLSFVYGAHPSCNLVPVVLSVGESTKASGQDILAAYVIGFEACARISSPIAQSHYMQGWHSTGNIGILGATAAAARLLGLNVQQIKMAYGIVASMASGLRYNIGTMTKPLHAGNAASNGTLAAYLALNGFTARDNAIEAPIGFAKVFGCNDSIDWENAAANLGKVFTITKGISFKLYPSCGGTIGLMDEVLYLRDKYKINASDIKEIILGVSSFENSTLIHHPTKGLEGKFSMEYCSCRALLDGKVGLQNFTDEEVNQPEVQKLMARTKCIECYPTSVMKGEASVYSPQSVTVKTYDGQEYFRETPMIEGRRASTATIEKLEAKFRDCASLVLENSAVEDSLTMLRDLKKLSGIRELMNTLSGIK